MRKGSHHTEKAKQKISEKLKGCSKSKETKQKMSGHIPWNKGLTKKTDPRIIMVAKKVSAALTGHTAWNKGLTKETDSRCQGQKGSIPWNKGLTKDSDSRLVGVSKKSSKSLREQYRRGKRDKYLATRKANEAVRQSGRDGTWPPNKNTEEWERQASERNSGKNNPNWKGGKSKEPYSPDWTEALKRAIRKRDNHTCQLCGKKAKCVHHINFDKMNCNPYNLCILCYKCNALASRENITVMNIHNIMGWPEGVPLRGASQIGGMRNGRYNFVGRN